MPGCLAFSTFSAVSRAVVRAAIPASAYNPVYNVGADYGEGKRTCPEKKRGFNLGFIGTFRRVAKDGEGLQTKPLADGEAFEHEGEARTFGAAERQDHGGL